VIILFRLLALLPLPVLHAVGVLVGWLSFGLSPTYRRRFRDNAIQAGYRPASLWRAVAESGKLVAEVPRLWFGRPVPVEWAAEDLVASARQQGRGIVFLTPHLGCFEVTAQAYAARHGRITVLYRPARKPWLRNMVDRARTRDNLRAVPTTLAGVRDLLRALKAGEAVGLLPDQVPPQGQGVWAPFFGKPAYTMTLLGRLQEASDAAIVFCFAERLPQAAGYRLHIDALEEPLPGDRQAAARRVNAAVERLIRACPTQYLWGYNRYKRPAGAPPPPA